MPARLTIPELNSPKWLRRKYCEEKLTANAIGELLGTTKQTVLRRLQEFGIDRRVALPHISSLAYRDEAWLREQYWDKGLTTYQMAKLVSTNPGTIQVWMRKHNIPFRDRANQLCKNEVWLREKYWDEGLNTTEIAGLADITPSTVHKWMIRHNIPRRSTDEMAEMSKYAQYKNREWLWEQYVDRGLSTYEIADNVGCSFQTVCKWLEEFDIPRRDWVAQFRYENREPSWNDKFFDELSPDAAYIIGFLIADGHLRSCDNGTRYVVSFSQKEGAILRHIAEVVGWGGELHDMQSGGKALSLNSKHAHTVLAQKYNIPIGRAKSYTVCIPQTILDKPDMVSHCIRGIFDGDGTVDQWGRRMGFSSGSRRLLEDIAAVLEKEVGLPVPEIKWGPGGYTKKNGEQSGAYNIGYAVLDGVDFAKFIYGPALDVYGSTLYLERKLARFQNVCDCWHSKEWLRSQIEDRKRLCSDIAKEIGVRTAIVSRVVAGLGIYDFPFKNPEWLKNAVVHEGKSANGIARSYGVRPDAVDYYIDKFDLRTARDKYWNLELGI